MALAFRDDESLRVVLTSGLCPPEIAAQGAKVARDAKGGVVLAPDRPLPRAAAAALAAAGIAIDAKLPDGARGVRCWAEALGLVRAPVGQIPALVLMTTAAPAGVVTLAAELLRLGCEHQELLFGAAGGVVRVTDPPTYTVMRAIDREDGLRVYAPDPPGQDAVFTELGFRHPLAGRLPAEPGHLLLVGPDGWRSVPDQGWRSLEAALQLAIPAEGVALTGKPPVERRRVELRLAPGRRDAPSLWVIRDGGLAALDRLLAYLPEDVVGRLTFAATAPPAGGGPGAIIVRARTSRHPPPDLSLDAEVYAPIANLPDVYVPAGAIIEPPLRRERLRAILGVEAGQVAWLAPAGADPNKGPFRVERISDAAFAPLAEWSEYVIQASGPALVPWARAVTFDFAAFVSTGLEWAAAPPPERELPAREPSGRAKPPRRRATPAPAQPAPVTAAQPAPPPRERAPREGAARVEEVQLDEELVRLEQAFVALDAPADAPERLSLLEQLGRAYLRLGRRRDAGLCFARAVWELSGPAADARLDAWIAAELGRATVPAALDAALGQRAPSTDDVRRVAAIAARAPEPVRRDPHRVQRWLDDHDQDLDARSLWLARVGLARLAGGDPLGLATARDRILARLAGGLPVERELPSFLRFAGRSGALGNASGEQLGTALEQLLERLRKTMRRRSENEAPEEYTRAYATLQIAHGFARIGKHERARALVLEARGALAAVISNPVHAYLVAAFEARVEQAIAGHPPETPFPQALNTQYLALERMARYAVDRLGEASRILSPLEQPTKAHEKFTKSQVDARGPEFAALRALSDPAARAQALARLLQTAAATEVAERAQLIDGCLDLMLELPESHIVSMLRQAVPLIATLPEQGQAVLYAEALLVSAHFGRNENIPDLLEALSTAIRAVPGDKLNRVLDQSLRTLRRIGLRNEMAELLARAENTLAAGTANLQARLALASGLAYLGDTARALPILDQAREALATLIEVRARTRSAMRSVPVERLELTRALALAYAHAPLNNALSGIADLSGQLRDMTDMLSTNTYFCWSVLHFVESLVLGITSDDLALGEAGRRFVEDDEHLIRRRLHRDLGGA